MKKILLAVTLLGISLFGFVNVNAEEVNLNEIDTNTYIIGERIYQLNSYYISIYDVVNASSEYARNNNGAIAPIYYLVETGLGEKQLIEITGPYNQETGMVPSENVELEEIYPDGIMDATSINGEPLYDFLKNNVEPQIKESVATLNETANDYGFSSITYANNTVTFNMNDLTKVLSGYKDSGIVELFINLDGATKAVYNLGTAKEVDLTNLTTQKVVDLAQEILTYLADGKDLVYESIANKSISAEFTFEYEGYEYTDTYTVEFVYDIEELKDLALEEVAKELNETATNYGFESIVYDKETKTATFTISDLTRGIADYKNSGIVELFMLNMDGATKAVYNLGTAKEVDLTNLTTQKVVDLAQEIMIYLADGKDLVYESIANKSISADITYVVNGEEKVVTYTVEFVK